MRRAFDMYDQIDHGSARVARDESGLRPIRRARRDTRHRATAYEKLAPDPSFHPWAPASFVEEVIVPRYEDPSQPSAAYGPCDYAPPPSARRRRDASMWRIGRSEGVSSERIALEALATLAGVVLVAFVCSFVFHVELSLLHKAWFPKEPPKVAMTTTTSDLR